MNSPTRENVFSHNFEFVVCRVKSTDKMTPVSHDVPSNPPIHNSTDNFGQVFLMNTAMVVVDFTVSDTKEDQMVKMHENQDGQFARLLVRIESFCDLNQLTRCLAALGHSAQSKQLTHFQDDLEHQIKSDTDDVWNMKLLANEDSCPILCVLIFTKARM